MRSKRLRIVVLLAALSVLAAACSKPANRGAASGSVKTGAPSVGNPVQAGGSTTTTAAAANAGATPVGGGNVSAGATPNGGSQSSGPSQGGGNTLTTEPGIDQSQATAVGANVMPQSTTRGSKPYYQGVGDSTIQLDFSIDATSCGVNVTNALTAAGGALPTQTQFYRSAPTTQDQVVAENKEAIATMVQYFNDHGFDAGQYFPHIRNLMGNDPKNQYFGRHFVYNVIDGGSNQCPDKTRAAATQAAEQDKAFAVFNNYDGAQYNMAADLHTFPAANRPMHFGTLWGSDSTYNQFAPYAWTQFATGTTIVNQLASYICSRLVGKNAVNSPQDQLHGGYSNVKRKFGLVHTNLPQDAPVINDFKAAVAKYCPGGDSIIAKEVSYDGTDFSNAQRDDTNLIAQLHTSGITSVIMLGDPVQGLFQTDDAKGQNYFPEWIVSSIGFMDSNTVNRLWDQSEAAGDFGTSNLGVYGGFGFGAGDPFWVYHTYHQTAPDGKPCDPTSEAGMDHGSQSSAADHYCKAPDALVTWYYTMLDFVGGTLFAGPNLNPQNVSVGLQHYPVTRYGSNGPTSDPRPALVGPGVGKYGFVVDAVEWKWMPNFTSPPPESKKGFIEYPDCMRHYLLWPNDLAPNWRPSDPAYNQWCDNPQTGYPKTLPNDGQH